jgi:hypothetical protein
MKKLILLILTFLFLFSVPNVVFSGPYDLEVLKKAESYLYVRELNPINGNRSPEIDMWLKYVGLPPGLSYCVTFNVYCVGSVYEAHGKRNPLPKIGRVSTLLKIVKKDKYAFTVVPAKDVEYGSYILKPGMIAIWSNNKKLDGSGLDKYDWAGHAEFVTSPLVKSKFGSIGANTIGVDDIRSQREQAKTGPVGGVYRKSRNISKLKSFNTEAFIKIN